MGAKITWQERGKYLAVNFILLTVLFLSVSFNKKYLRPAFAGSDILDILTGSFPNFMAAYVISLSPAYPILNRRLNAVRGTRMIVATATVVFIILTIEELASLFGASTVLDGYDIVASALGSSCAILTFHILRRVISRPKNETETQ